MEGIHHLLSRRRLLSLGAAALAGGAGALQHSSTTALTLSNVTGTINADVVNVRSGPSSSHSKVGQLRHGAIVTCLAPSGVWFKIQTATMTGYVDSYYVTLRPLGKVKTYTRGRTDRKLVALTFDAGADRGFAVAILDKLKQQRVVASFGMTGHWTQDNPDLVERIADEGHQLINHTLSHRSFTGSDTQSLPLTPAERLTELVRTEQLIKKAAGVRAKPWFRPPFGDYDDGVLRDIAAVSFSYNVMWTVDSLGWDGFTRDEIVSRCLSHHGNGYIYLLHVGSRSQDGPALGTIINGLRRRGYRFGTVAEVVGLATVPPTPTSIATASPSPRRTATRTPQPTATPSFTETPTSTPTTSPTSTRTPAPTETLTAMPSVEPSLEAPDEPMADEATPAVAKKRED